MKKLTLIISVAVMATTSFAQTAKEIVDRYMKATNLTQIGSDKAYSLMVEDNTSQTIEGNTFEVNSKYFMKKPDKKLRVERDDMGNPIIIINGNEGWMTLNENVSTLQAHEIDQMLLNIDSPLSSLVWEDSKFDFEYLGEKDDSQFLSIIPNNNNADRTFQSMKVEFSKKTGLVVSKENVYTEGFEAKVLFSDYKQFDNLYIPSVITIYMSGEIVATIAIAKVRLTPIADEMFTKPN